MKIGILSMQKIPNYGSFLQALSLKKQFEARGHEVFFIDIQEGRQICSSHNAKINVLKKFDRYFFKRLENYFFSKKMNKIHVCDYIKYLNVDKFIPQNEMFDLVVIGSDEVFNATTPSRWGFTTQLFGDVKNAKRIVTYAASCGSTTYEKVKEFDIVEDIKNALSNVEYISVRDINTLNFVNQITGIAPELNVDPVFISDYDEYIPKIKIKKPYMLVYAYVNRINDLKEINAIKKYAKKHNLEIVSVGTQQRWCNHNITANAFELLSYVKNAKCIVTDTFHGSVFSIKYNKKFVSLVRDSNCNKLVGLLNQFELSNRIVEDMSLFETTMNSVIDYDSVNERIKKEQEKSYHYLNKITNEGE